MKINLRLTYKIKWIHLLSIISLLLCLNIPCIAQKIKGKTLVSMLRWAIIAILIYMIFIFNKEITITFQLIVAYFLFLFVVSFMQKTNIINLIDMAGRILLICAVLELFRNDYLEIIKIWRDILFVLVIIDAISMLLYPNGMYTDDLYSINWFLGYKTARLAYSLPLCTFQAYLSQMKKKKYDFLCLFVLVLSVSTLFYSQGTAASVSLLLFGIIIYLLNLEKFVVGRKSVFNYLFNFKFVIPIYAIIVFMTVTIEKNTFMQNIVVNYLKKDITLTTRTFIWRNCLQVFNRNIIFGNGYLDSNQYVELTGSKYATSAHNMVLTLLVISGIIGLILYVIIILYSTQIINKDKTQAELVLLSGILVLLIVGVTSSAMIFSIFGFSFYELLTLHKERKKIYIEQSKKLHIKKQKKNKRVVYRIK